MLDYLFYAITPVLFERESDVLFYAITPVLFERGPDVLFSLNNSGSFFCKSICYIVVLVVAMGLYFVEDHV